jgi:predicted glycogen debranching enzyme
MPTSLAPTAATISPAVKDFLEREWLETDGLGGYASSTAALCSTRRYHGLLVAPFPGTHRRHVFLSRLEETVRAGGRELPLSMARYAGAWSPVGAAHLDRFAARPVPTFHFSGEGLEVTREIAMVRGRSAVMVRYRASAEVELVLRPFFACREADALTFENDGIERALVALPRGFRFQPYRALPAVAVTCSPDAELVRDPTWYKRFEYVVDLARGYDGHEDQFSPGQLRVRLPKGREFVVAATLGEPIADPSALWTKEAKARGSARAPAPNATVRERAAAAADDFLFRTAEGRLTVCAGFPWFGEWGRDTFIALPGLTLARGDLDGCAEVLSGALPFMRRGLLPNVFGSGPDDSHYGSADAALWFARAVALYQQAGGDADRVADEYLPALEQIARAYRDGTDLGIAADGDCLVRAGAPGLNATWMDAQLESGPVTPRDGYAVEINGLWCSLLEHLAAQRRRRKDKASAGWSDCAKRARRAFVARFWLSDQKYLADTWNEGRADASVRPNMIIAAALEWSPLDEEMRAAVVERARAELLTPRGLRTLSPRDARYRGRYAGSQAERDVAYHQGTVWPWLLGFYVEASLRAHGATRELVEGLRGLWEGFAAELDRGCAEHIAEVFGGDAPHAAGGTFAQAWNTAELLRSLALLDGARKRPARSPRR